MKKIIVLMFLATILHVGMTKQEFQKANGFPGECQTTTMPGVRFEECQVERYNSIDSYNYINGRLFSWSEAT